jgi:hypothetical protein
MYVHEYLEMAASSELAPLNVGDISFPKGVGADNAQYRNQQRLINYLNAANLEVHKVFQLIQRRLSLCNKPPGCIYKLPLDFMHCIYASFVDGQEIPLNNDRVLVIDGIERCVSIMFPAPYIMEIKGLDIMERYEMGIVYVAAPPKVCEMDSFIDLNPQYTEPILNYMAYKGHASQNGSIDKTNNVYWKRFRDSCNNVKTIGLGNVDNLDDNCKLIRAGFV